MTYLISEHYTYQSPTHVIKYTRYFHDFTMKRNYCVTKHEKSRNFWYCSKKKNDFVIVLVIMCLTFPVSFFRFFMWFSFFFFSYIFFAAKSTDFNFAFYRMQFSYSIIIIIIINDAISTKFSFLFFFLFLLLQCHILLPT